MAHSGTGKERQLYIMANLLGEILNLGVGAAIWVVKMLVIWTVICIVLTIVGWGSLFAFICAWETMRWYGIMFWCLGMTPFAGLVLWLLFRK
jgi:hypothetical protein